METDELCLKKKKGRKKKKILRRSPVWAYFTDERKTAFKSFVRCKICKRVLVAHNHQNSNLHRHLEVHRITVYKKKQSRGQLPDLNSISKRKSQTEDKPSTLKKPKEEPDIIFHIDDDDDGEDSFSLNLITPDNSRESSLTESQFATTTNSEELQQPESSTSPVILQNTNSNGTNLEENVRDLNCNIIISNIRTDTDYLKSKMTLYENDDFFIKSVAAEIDNMTEDSKDFMKAAIWEIIFKIKSAKRKGPG